MKLYGVESHAIDQAVERLGRKREHAHHELNQLMQTARYQGDDGKGRIFDHLASRTRLILDRKKDKIITVYPMDSVKPTKWYDAIPTVAIEVKPKSTGYNAIIEKARVVIQRELAKARRQFTTDTRKLTLFEAELGLDIARLTVNKAKCKAPHTKALLQERINELEIGRQAVAKQLQTVADRFEQMRKDAESYIGG